MSEQQQQSQIKSRGTKEEVFNGLALKTSGGLGKEQLMQNAKGKIISKAKHDLGKKAIGKIHGSKIQEEEEKKNDESLENIAPIIETDSKEESVEPIEQKIEEPLPEEKKEEVCQDCIAAGSIEPHNDYDEVLSNMYQYDIKPKIPRKSRRKIAQEQQH